MPVYLSSIELFINRVQVNMNFFEHECHLHVRVPRIKRDDGKVRLILPPWAGQLNGFSTLFEAFVIKFCKHMPVHNVCQLMNISDYKVWKLLDIYVDKARPSENLSGGFKRYRTLWYG